MKIEIGSKVNVRVMNWKTNSYEWREGEVKDIGSVNPGGHEKGYNYWKIKHKGTYLDTSTGQFYDKENIALFFDNEIKETGGKI